MAQLLRFPVTNDDLSAFIDHELDPIHEAVVAGAVYADRAKWDQIAAYRAQNACLGEYLSEVEAEPIPDRLLDVVAAFRNPLRKVG